MDSDGLTIQNTGGIPYGGIKVQETKKLFYQFRNYYRKTYPDRSYPGDLSFNIFLWGFLEKNNEVVNHIYISSVYNALEKYIVYHNTANDLKIYYGGFNPGEVVSLKGERKPKVVFFNKLKKIWRDNSMIPITDYELNEFISNRLARDKKFNLEDYLKHTNSNKIMNEKQVWNELFPNANLKEEEKKRIYDNFRKLYPGDDFYGFIKNFSDINQNYDWKKYISVFLPHIIKKHDSDSFPLSLQSTLKKFPIPGTYYNNQPSPILNEFEITVANNQSFKAKFRDIFKSVIITFKSAAQCKRWQGSPNMNYWPQQLNFAVWCATSGCGICLNEGYPKRIQEFINFHIYFTTRRILWELKIPLPDDTIFNQTSNHYDKIDQKSDFRFRGGKNLGLGTIFVNGRIPFIASGLIDWPNSTPIFHDEPGIGGVNGKIINIANRGKPYEWFTPNVGEGLTKTSLGRLNRSVEAFVYCVVGAEVNVRSSIVDSGGGGQETQQEMLKLFEEAVIEEDIAKSVLRYQLAIQEAKLRLDFAIAPDVWLMPSNLIINTESVIGYNNFLLKADRDMTFGENKLLNNMIRKVGIAHNLGTSKKNQQIEKIDESDNVVNNFETKTDHLDDDDDDDSHINIINKQPSIGSSHDLKKATAIIIAGVVGYMMFS